MPSLSEHLATRGSNGTDAERSAERRTDCGQGYGVNRAGCVTGLAHLTSIRQAPAVLRSRYQEICGQCNGRYLDTLAHVDDPTPALRALHFGRFGSFSLSVLVVGSALPGAKYGEPTLYLRFRVGESGRYGVLPTTQGLPCG